MKVASPDTSYVQSCASIARSRTPFVRHAQHVAAAALVGRIPPVDTLHPDIKWRGRWMVSRLSGT